MLLNNHLAPERRDFSRMVFSGLLPGSGVLFEEFALDEQIGSEVVALLIEPEPDELIGKRTLDLNLKAGIAATAYGPVLFLIWWIPPIVNGHPAAFYEQIMNPLYLNTSEILRRLADQTHLHVIVTNLTGQVVTVFEYANTFGFDGIRAGTECARVAWHGPADFAAAKEEYEAQYQIDDILAGRSD
jgi:hypothetical protein